MTKPDSDSADLAVGVVLAAREETIGQLQDILDGMPLEMHSASNSQAALLLVQKHRPRFFFLDCAGLGGEPREWLARLLDLDPGLSVILIGAEGSTEAAVDAILHGAADYLSSPLQPSVLRERFGRLLSEALRRRRSLTLDTELAHQFSFEGIVGRAPEMLDLFDRMARIAPHFTTVLVTGATGTGKELVAQALHRQSPWAKGPFVTCNCSAIVETLFESELFGHVRGAFTGATQDRVGLLEYASGGTIFLDEIGDLPLTTQAKLLRALQEREIQRVGSPVARKINVRVVAATNRDLSAMVAERSFREDLYHRLAAIELHLPRLADRREDLPLLTRHFLQRISAEQGKPLQGLTRRTQTLLARYHWPGNVRELENVLRHAAMMAQGPAIDVRDLPERLRAVAAAGAEPGEQRVLTMEEVQRRHAREVVQALGGNKLRASKALGISRATLYKLLADSPEA